MITIGPVTDAGGNTRGNSERAAVSVMKVASNVTPLGSELRTASTPGRKCSCGGTGSRL
jgi:hypothetical protein